MATWLDPSKHKLDENYICICIYIYIYMRWMTLKIADHVYNCAQLRKQIMLPVSYVRYSMIYHVQWHFALSINVFHLLGWSFGQSPDQNKAVNTIFLFIYLFLHTHLTVCYWQTKRSVDTFFCVPPYLMASHAARSEYDHFCHMQPPLALSMHLSYLLGRPYGQLPESCCQPHFRSHIYIWPTGQAPHSGRIFYCATPYLLHWSVVIPGMIMQCT